MLLGGDDMIIFILIFVIKIYLLLDDFENIDDIDINFLGF